MHIHCAEAKKVWEACGLLSDVANAIAETEDYRSCFFSIMQNFCEDKMRKFTAMLWVLWRRRNDKVWNGNVQPVRQTVSHALDYLHEWCWVRDNKLAAARVALQQQQGDHKWEKPEQGRFKCNVDASLFATENQYGIGMCIRSSTGSFVKGRTMCFNGTPTPQEAETIGLWNAILWIREMGLRLVTIELDCLPVVNGLKASSIPNNEFGALVTNCKNLLSSCLSFQVSFIRRQANLAAHTLARAARSYARSHVFDLTPSCIESILLNEMK